MELNELIRLGILSEEETEELAAQRELLSHLSGETQEEIKRKQEEIRNARKKTELESRRLTERINRLVASGLFEEASHHCRYNDMLREILDGLAGKDSETESAVDYDRRRKAAGDLEQVLKEYEQEKNEVIESIRNTAEAGVWERFGERLGSAEFVNMLAEVEKEGSSS